MAMEKMYRQIMERLDRIEALLQQQAGAPAAPPLPKGAVSATIETVETVVADEEPGKDADERAVPRRSRK